MKRILAERFKRLGSFHHSFYLTLKPKILGQMFGNQNLTECLKGSTAYSKANTRSSLSVKKPVKNFRKSGL